VVLKVEGVTHSLNLTAFLDWVFLLVRRVHCGWPLVSVFYMFVWKHFSRRPGRDPVQVRAEAGTARGLLGPMQGCGVCCPCLDWSLLVFSTEPLSVDNMASGLGQPGVGSDGLPSLESGLCPFQQLDEPPTVPLPQQPPALTDPAEYTSAPATSQPNASPRLAVDFALPEELPLMSSHVDLSGDPEEPVAPAQVALSVTEFGLIGIGDVNPFLAGHPVCPAPPLHSEPLSQ
jgi:hypothetical protein